MDYGALGSAEHDYIGDMSTDQIMQLTYLVILAAAIGGTAIAAGRQQWGKMAQQLAIWALIFVGVIAAYGLWEELRNDIAPQQAMITDSTVTVPRGPDGHYRLTLAINDRPVRFVVDTGASQMVLSQRDAAAVGLDPADLNYSGMAFTANGAVRTAPVTLPVVQLEGITDRNVPAVVNQGAMDGSLLGMSYLRLFDRIEIADDMLVLQR